MNGTTPQPFSGRSQPKTSGLAISSLVLGILGLVTCLSIFTGIPGVICGHVALSKIKQSGGILTGQGLAIAGLVCGYLSILLIPLMAAIAIPNFVRARHISQMNACVNNLRTIDGAKQQWVLEHPDKKDTVPTPADLDIYLGGFNRLNCPAGGTYDIKAPTVPPTCSIPEHHLD